VRSDCDDRSRATFAAALAARHRQRAGRPSHCTVQRLSQRLGLPSREEFEVQRALLEDARARLARVQAQVEVLAARLDGNP
jgi:Uncharacterized protein conserved in bacteria